METNNVIPLFNDDLDSVAKMAEEIANENEDISALRDIAQSENDPLDGLVERIVEFGVKSDGTPDFTNASGTLKESELDLMEAIDGGLKEENDESFKNAFTSNVVQSYDMSDADAAALLDCIMAYKKDNKINVYSRMPATVKRSIDNICIQNGIPLSEKNAVAKQLCAQFISEAATDQTFIDFEKALDKAMKIPSMTDLYNEHLNETMDKRLPIMAEAIEKEDPVKAKMLREIGYRFTNSITYTMLREFYESNSRARKTVRRDYEKVSKLASELNYANRDSDFKMPDASTLLDIVFKAVVNNDTELTDVDAAKFLTLVFKSIENFNKKEVLDASYIYYLIKNISMLSYINESAKSSFSAELINNIKIMMFYIRAKEREFNVDNTRSEHKQKRSKRERARK